MSSLVYFKRAMRCSLLVFVSMLVVCIFTVPQGLASLGAAHQFDNSTPARWSAVEYWKSAADCARESGMLLVACTGSGPKPMAEVFNSDDYGHALALGIYSIARDRPIYNSDVSKLNTIVNFAGIAAISALLLSMNFFGAALLFLATGGGLVGSWHAVAPHPAMYGIICFAALLPLAIVGHASNVLRGRAFWIWLVIGILALCMSLLFRQAVGMIGLVSGLMSLGYLASRDWRTRKSFKFVWLAIPISLASFFPIAVMTGRDLVYSLTPTDVVEQHGFTHALYLGLGVVPNTFGIEWDDALGYQVAKSTDPDIRIYTEEYFDALGNRYWDAVKQNPAEVARIYWEKATTTANSPAPSFYSGISTWKLIIFSILFSFTALMLFWKRGSAEISMLLVIYTIIFGFSMQATLIHPSFVYFAPAYLLVLLSLCLSTSVLLKYATSGGGLDYSEKWANKPESGPPAFTNDMDTGRRLASN